MKKKLFLFILILISFFILGCGNIFGSTKEKGIDGDGEIADEEDLGETKYIKEYWGTWIRMDTGDEYKITNSDIKKGEYTTTEVNSLEKSSDNILLLDEKYLLFRKGGYNRDFSLSLSGFSSNRSAIISRAIGFSDVIVRTNTENIKDTQSVKVDSTGKIKFTDAVADSTQAITAGSKYIDATKDPSYAIEIVNVTPQYNGEDLGTLPIVEKGKYGFKTTYEVSNSDNGYLYGNCYKTYKIKLNVENIGTVDCSSSMWNVYCNDNKLEIVSGGGVGNFTTIEPKKTKELELEIKYGTFDSSFKEDFKDVTINIDITDVDTRSKWEDAITLRFYQRPISLYVNAIDFNKGNARLNGFVIHPNGKSQFFTVGNNNSKSISFPWSNSDYKLVFSGANADNEMGYSFATTSNLADLATTFTVDELGSYEPNNTEYECKEISNISTPIKSYLKKNDIDFYSFNVSTLSNKLAPANIFKTEISDSTSFSENNNGDDMIQPDETIRLDVAIKNTSLSSTSDISGVLSSESEYITITQNTFDYGSIEKNRYSSAGSKNNSSCYTKASSNKAFQYTVSSSAPVGEKITFILTMTDKNGNTWAESFELEVVATGASMTIEKKAISDSKDFSEYNNGDSTIQAGETIRMDIAVKNSGTSLVLGVVGVLSSESEYITITQNTFDYGTIETGRYSSAYSQNYYYNDTSASSDKAFQFSVSSSAPMGTKLPFVLTMTDKNGNTWAESFELEVQ